MNDTHIYMPEDHMDKLYTSKNPCVRYIHEKRLKIIVNSIPNKNNLKILDAGCGEGHLLQKLYEKNKKYNYIGIDITEAALLKAKKRCPYANIKKMNLSRLEFRNNSFDVITCTEVIEHIYEYERVFSEFKRVLKKGGSLILTFPNETMWTIGRFFLMRRPIKVPDHVNSFSPKIIKNEIGLELIRQTNLPFYLPFFVSLGSVMVFNKN
ncbi:MAG: class I SAM-dependent methyltransferase [Nanoarchaeota archaeon]